MVFTFDFINPPQKHHYKKDLATPHICRSNILIIPITQSPFRPPLSKAQNAPHPTIQHNRYIIEEGLN